MEIKQEHYEPIKVENATLSMGYAGKRLKQAISCGNTISVTIEESAIPALMSGLSGRSLDDCIAFMAKDTKPAERAASFVQVDGQAKSVESKTTATEIKNDVHCPKCGEGKLGTIGIWADLGGGSGDTYYFSCGHQFIDHDTDKPARKSKVDVKTNEFLGEIESALIETIWPRVRETIKCYVDMAREDGLKSADRPAQDEELDNIRSIRYWYCCKAIKSGFSNERLEYLYNEFIKFIEKRETVDSAGRPVGDGDAPAYGPKFEFGWNGDYWKIVDNGNLFDLSLMREYRGGFDDDVAFPDDKEFWSKVIPFIAARLSYRKKEVWEKV